ncbi:hypothetical protein [Phytohabitans houttuyneae]|jgi:Tfp pilus assembly protein PilO|uniref:Uncharacterized protein n=1 Tax=Phytohabitans houttuyneae TaxID=1076126 RepID=A0A6V8K4N4_9ACTN|nr:hypothetical protein [Phytohabitans houttuyneae]GFJ76946.1 hypothetical protein Phou_011260 [Phytohabitans houttuyneae]
MTWQETVMGALAIIFLLVILVVVIVQLGATWRARQSVAREQAYRTLAEQAAATQRETAQRLETMQADLAELRERTGALERLLKEVEEPWTR